MPKPISHAPPPGSATTLPHVWWDGQLRPEAEALIPAISQGLLWGRGLFETIAVREGLPFALTRHLDRFRTGAARLALQPPDDSILRGAITAVLANAPPEHHRLRITLTGGESSGLVLTPEPGHLLIRLTPVSPGATQVSLLTVPWRRNEFSPLSDLKCTSYAENALALAWAIERGATEGLFLNSAGDLCEGTVSNLFLVRGGTVLTPAIGSGCLPGITRSLILDLASQLGLPCIQKALTPADLAAADEVFLTNSIHGVRPAASCDRHHFHCPGPVTLQLTAALEDMRQRLPDP